MSNLRHAAFNSDQTARETRVSSLLDYLETNSHSHASPITPANPSEELIEKVYGKILEVRTHILDKNNSTNSRIMTENDGKKIWLRDADGSNDGLLDKTTANPSIHKYNYLRLFYAYVIAAIAIVQIHQLAKHNPTLIGNLEKLADNIDIASHDEKNVLQLVAQKKGALIALLDDAWKISLERTNEDRKATVPASEYLPLTRPDYAQHGKESIEQMLDQTKDWAALEEPSMAVATVINNIALLDGRTVVILDEPCSELTEEQKELLDGFRQKELLDGFIQKQWYLRLTYFQQKLVAHYLPKILAGDRVIPSQLRAILPLGKNTYRQTVHLQKEVGKKEYTQINDYFHTGTPAYLAPGTLSEDALNATLLTLEQQKANSHADATVMVVLNSSLADSIVGTLEYLKGNKYTRDDSTIIQLVHHAVKKLHKGETSEDNDGEKTEKHKDPNIHYAKICLNGFRNVEFNNYSGAHEILNIVKNTVEFFKKITVDIKQERNDINKLIEKFHSLLGQFYPRDKNVKGQDIIYCLARLSTLNNSLVTIAIKNNLPGAEELRTTAVIFGCASGENRTGIVYFNTLVQTLAMQACHYVKGYEQPRFRARVEDIMNRLMMRAQITNIMTGFQGSIFGTEGIRDKSSSALKPDQPRELIQSTADYKNLPTLDGEFDAALLALQAELKKNNQNTGFIRPYAQALAEHAAEDRKAIAVMEKPERNAYIEALQATTNILTSPKLFSAAKRLQSATAGINNLDCFKPKPNPSRKMSVGGIMMCITGAALITIAAATLVATCGASSFASAAVAAIGGSLIAHAIVSGSVCALGTVLVGGGALLTKQGFFGKSRSIVDQLDLINKKISAEEKRDSTYHLQPN